MAVGMAASRSGTAVRDGLVLPAWTRLRRPAARVCTLPIDSAVPQRHNTRILRLSSRRKARYDGPTLLLHTIRRATGKKTEKIAFQLQAVCEHAAFLGPIPSSTGVRAASYATTEKPRRL